MAVKKIQKLLLICSHKAQILLPDTWGHVEKGKLLNNFLSPTSFAPKHYKYCFPYTALGNGLESKVCQ